MAAQPVKIGAILSQSGALSPFEPATANALSLAVAEINAAGGILGQTLDVVTVDDHSEARDAVSAAQHLITAEKVRAIVGPMGSASFAAVATQVAAPHSIPVLSASATATTLDGIDSKGFAFRASPSDVLQGAALAAVARDKGYKAVSVVYVASDYGKGLAQAFSDAYGRLGGKVVTTIPFAAKTAGDHDEPKKAAVDNKAEAMVAIAYPDDGVSLVKGALEGGFFNKFLLSDGLMDQGVIDGIGGQFLDGVSLAIPAVDAAGHEAFAKAYGAKFGPLPPTPYLDRAYDSVWLLALAAEKAQSTEGPKLRDALREVTGDGGEKVGPGDFAKARQLIHEGRKITYVGAAGPYKFDARGGVSAGFVHWQIQDGKFGVVRPLPAKP